MAYRDLRDFLKKLEREGELRRISTDVAEAHLLDVKKMLDAHDLREDLHLRPGDFIFVPQSRIAKMRKFVPTNSMSWYMNPLQF